MRRSDLRCCRKLSTPTCPNDSPHLRSDPDATLAVAGAQLGRQGARATRQEMPWLDVWDAVLGLPIGVICHLLADEGQFARDLRQSSPMTVVLTDDERREVIGATR